MKENVFGRLIDSVKQLGCEIGTKTVVEMHANGTVYVSGCEKISAYSGEIIEMKCSDAIVKFCGSDLRLENLINGQIAVKGRVVSVDFKYD